MILRFGRSPELTVAMPAGFECVSMMFFSKKPSVQKEWPTPVYRIATLNGVLLMIATAAQRSTFIFCQEERE
jgi:hypothetical protein